MVYIINCNDRIQRAVGSHDKTGSSVDPFLLFFSFAIYDDCFVWCCRNEQKGGKCGLLGIQQKGSQVQLVNESGKLHARPKCFNCQLHPVHAPAKRALHWGHYSQMHGLVFCSSFFWGSSGLCQYPNRADSIILLSLSLIFVRNWIISSTKQYVFPLKEKINSTGRETSWCKQQNNTNVQVVQGIRLWFLPGVAEVSRELVPQQGEVRFGMDIKRTEEVINHCTFKSQDCL